MHSGHAHWNGQRTTSGFREGAGKEVSMPKIKLTNNLVGHILTIMILLMALAPHP
jgi:hypothetical protein